MKLLSKIRKKKEDNAPAQQAEMSFFDHLEELRWHILRSLAYIVVVAIALFFAKDFVFHQILLGPTRADFVTYEFICGISESLCFSPGEIQVFTKDLGEQFLSHIKVTLWLGLIVSCPLIFREIWSFVKPGLYDRERKSARGIVFICSLLFLLGILFGYFVISPFAISFLSNYSVSIDVEETLTLKSMISWMTMLTIPTGLVFQLPILVFLLAKLGLIYPNTMKKYRRHAIIVILALAAIITPPDVITQFLIGIPLYILYEISIVICKRVNPDQDNP